MKQVLLAVSAGLAGAVHFQSAGVNPVSRTVELLRGLREQAEDDMKKEEALFEKFMCWAKTTISTKKTSNKEAQARIEELETYIADIEAGRIEFTTERVDLEKELEELNSALEEAKDLRDKEHKEFLAAEDEMTKTSEALKEAVSVLNEATEGHEKGVLAQMRRADLRAMEGFAQREEKAEELTRVADLGERVLTKGDALFLRKLLTGEVPKPDWKKLNRKATFKMAYKARSFKIQAVLAKLKQTVDDNLKDATAKEEEALKSYDKLKTSKTQERDAAEDALMKSEGESGARGQNKGEAQTEVDALKQQVSNDDKFIEQTQTALDEKNDEWKERSALRMGEISAISKAIEILSNDDARDLMTKSYKSQGYLFLQENSRVGKMRSEAADAIQRIVAATSDSRLAALVAMARTRNSHFTEVIAAIDKMIGNLKDEEESDLETKERCEKDRDEQTREAALKSRHMDEVSDDITKLQSEIADIKAEIEEKKETIRKTKEAVEKAEEQRKAEYEEYQNSRSDDKQAFLMINKAKHVLEDFYKDNDLSLVQHKGKHAVPAGEAPEPPPSTWDKPYGGKKGESNGIISILNMLAEDVQKDLDHAKANEEKAEEEFDTFKKESEQQIKDLNDDIADLKAAKGKKIESEVDKMKERGHTNEELNTVMKSISDQRPGCDFFEVNYPTRLKNRQIEIDGLIKAKAILNGAKFEEGPDPNREIKPGDALVQRK